jgi:hypothetical protein
LLFPYFVIFAIIPRHETGKSIDASMIQVSERQWNKTTPWGKTTWQSHTERVRLHSRDDWGTVEDLRKNVYKDGGQFISLNCAEPQADSFPEMFYTALQNTRWDHSLQFSLPIILQHNPHVASPFINQAILWQRLCNLLIREDDSSRETVLVLENADQASPERQHEIARLIRFHETHALRRTFVLMVARDSCGLIIPELQDILER